MRTLLFLIALTTVVHADDGEHSVTEHYTVDGEHDLHVDVAYETLTGTSHYATGLELRTSTAKLVRAGTGTEMEAGDLLPLVEKLIAVAPKRWVMIGWSSTGGGMQTMVAWIVSEKANRLTITDAVEWTSDRTHAGFTIEDTNGMLRLGIQRVAEEDAHEDSDWKLQIGAKSVAFAKLHYAKTSTKTFAPPMETAREPAAPVAWITANGEHFTTK